MQITTLHTSPLKTRFISSNIKPLAEVLLTDKLLALLYRAVELRGGIKSNTMGKLHLENDCPTLKSFWLLLATAGNT